MKKPQLEIIEKTDTLSVYYLWQDISGYSLYESTRIKERFLKTESKIMESVLESDLRRFLALNGIIPYDMSESALKLAFDTLKSKRKRIDIIDRNLKTDEEIVGKSPNGMTVILDRYEVLSIAMEVRVVNI